MIRSIFLVIFSIVYLNGQTTTDKPVETCGHNQSASRWLSTESSLTENQELIDITYYRLSLDVDIENQNISGSVLANGHVGFSQPDFIEFDFSDEMYVDSIHFEGETWDFYHVNNLLKIPAPEIIIPEGYEFSIEIFYHGSPSVDYISFNFDTHAGENHIWTLSEPYGARRWWPCKDDPSDKADSMDIIITVPADQIVASNGLLVNEIELGDGRKQYHWEERYPICTYLVSVTSYPYLVWGDTYVSMDGDTMPIVFYNYPDQVAIADDNYLLTKDMIGAFAQRFGEYPFINEKYGHADFGRGGGMEHQTLSSMGGHSQWLIAHELGHQWWGDLLTCASFHHIWLNEGFARYCEAIWEESHNGVDAYKSYWESHTFYGPGTIYVEDPSSVGQIFNGNLSYNKAGWVVHMLRGVMGDNLFFETMKSYASNDSLAYNAVTTENFQAVCEDVSGLDLNAFFQQWIYGERYPQYSVSWEILDSDELIVTINQTQSWQLFHMPIDLQILTGLDTLNVTVENQNQTQEYNLGIVSQPLFNVILDPDDWILKSVEYLTLSNQVPGPDQITLFPAFPNPFNPETSISFFIPEKVGEIKSIIQIYDIKGR